MSPLVIAIGNPLRADDGVAHHLADLLHDVNVLRVHQLTPEIAAELQNVDPVIFLDADVTAGTPSLEPIEASQGASSALSHCTTPAMLIAIAASLYGFHGDAWLCRLYARDFSAATEPSPEARAQLERAADLVQQLLDARCSSPL